MSQVRPVVSAMLLCDVALSEEGTQQVSLIRLLRRLDDLAVIGERMSFSVAIHDRNAFSEFVFEVEEAVFDGPGRY
jgi:hypothetical protein